MDFLKRDKFFPKYKNSIYILSVLIFFLFIYLSFYPGLPAELFFIDDDITLSSVPEGNLNLKNLWTIWKPTPKPVFLPLNDFTFFIDFNLAKIFNIHPNKMMRLSNFFFLALSALMTSLLFSNCKNLPIVAFFLGLLFALHPLHVVPTLWIASRKDVLFCLLILTTVFLYTKRKLGLAFLAFLMAFFAKQTTYGLLFWILPYEFLFLSKDKMERPTILLRLRKMLINTSPFILATLIILPVSISLSTIHPSPMIFLWDKTYLLIQHYFLKVLWPYPITQYYPRPSGLSGFFTILSLLFLVILWVAPIFLFFKEKCSLWVASQILLAFALIQPYIITVPQVYYVNNAYAYAFIAPLLLVIFDFLWNGLKKPIFQKSLTFLLLIGCLACIPYDQFLAQDFVNPVKAFERNNRFYPNDRFILTRLGHAAYFVGDKEKALLAFEKALKIRLKESGQISKDAFEGIKVICSQDKDFACLESLGILAAKNSRPYYCQDLEKWLKQLSLTDQVNLKPCYQKFLNESSP